MLLGGFARTKIIRQFGGVPRQHVTYPAGLSYFRQLAEENASEIFVGQAFSPDNA